MFRERTKRAGLSFITHQELASQPRSLRLLLPVHREDDTRLRLGVRRDRRAPARVRQVLPQLRIREEGAVRPGGVVARELAACVGRERNRTHLRVVLREFLVHDHEAPERGLLRRGLRRRGGFRRARARVPRRVAHGARASVVSRRTPPASRGGGRPKNRSTQRAPDYVEEERGVQARGVFRAPNASQVARDHGERVRQAHARLGALARGCFRVAGTKEETRFKISAKNFFEKKSQTKKSNL